MCKKTKVKVVHSTVQLISDFDFTSQIHAFDAFTFQIQCFKSLHRWTSEYWCCTCSKTGSHFLSCILYLFFFQDMQVNCLAVINDTVGALMSCAHQDRECAIGLILGKWTVSARGWGVLRHL